MKWVSFLLVLLLFRYDRPPDVWRSNATQQVTSTLVGLRHPVIALQASFRTGSILAAWTDLLQTGDAFRLLGRGLVRIVICAPFSVSQLLKYLQLTFIGDVISLHP